MDFAPFPRVISIKDHQTKIVNRDLDRLFKLVNSFEHLLLKRVSTTKKKLSAPMISRLHASKTLQRLSTTSVLLSPLSRRAPVIQFHRTLFGTENKAGPPPLPKEEQEEFERLQKLAQTSGIIDSYNELAAENEDKEKIKELLKTKQTSDIGQINVFKTIPEFEGDVNPETGEIGGPKQDPLRHGDYSFNGRVTDF